MNNLFGKMLVLWCFASLFGLGCEQVGSFESEDFELDERAASTGHLSNSLLPGDALTTNQYLQSKDGSHRLNLQSDGNLVLRRMSDRKALWSSGTHGKSAARLNLQSDGNLVLRTAAGAAVWSSKTDGSGATRLYLHSAGRLVLYRDSTVVWSVNDSSTPGAGGAQNLWLITFDIGHANAELFVFPDGKTMMFDTGTEDKCKSKIIPFLRYHGINQLDYVIRSHEHADHVGGIKPLTDGGFINNKTLVQNCKSFKVGDRFNRSGASWYIYNASRGGMDNDDSVSFFMNYNGFRISGSGDEKKYGKEDFVAKSNGNEGISHSDFFPVHVRIYNEHATGNITYSFESKLNAYIWIFPTYEGNRNIQQAHIDVARNSPRFQKIVYMDKIHIIRASSGTEWESFYLDSISSKGKFLASTLANR